MNRLIRRPQRLSLLAVTLLLCGNNYAAAQSASNVLVVINEASQASRTIGDYYVGKRAVPAGNVCRITAKTDETIQRAEFDQQIHQPVARCITAAAAQDRILYIVLTKGVPIRIEGTGAGRETAVASVDSELTLLYRRMAGIANRPEGPLPNPYFAGASADGGFKPFTHERFDIFLVTRLDGFSVDDVLKLIDHGSAPASGGRIVLDSRPSWQDKGNVWLRGAAEALRAGGYDGTVEFDEGAKVVTDRTNVLGYYSWGSNDPAIKVRHFGFGFAPGALAATFVSSDARTFKEPPAEWTIGEWDNKQSYFAGSPQSLTGDLIRAGVTGTAGHVAEPFLDATIRPDILFPAYVKGANLAEAFYLAMPYLSWQTIVIGDPLCAPFRQHVLAAADVDRGLDSQTELPVFFSQQRMQAALRSGAKPEVIVASLRAEARMSRRDINGAVQALEEATAAEPRLAVGHATLGGIYLQRGQYDLAVDRYRKVLTYAPNDVISLNNLAYTLAVHQKNPAEALPLAERAAALVKNDPMLLDTLAWIYHLLDRHEDALVSMRLAAAGAPNSAEVRWHAAVIGAAGNDLKQAATDLEAALKLDPKLGDREDVQALRQRIAAPTPQP